MKRGLLGAVLAAALVAGCGGGAATTAVPTVATSAAPAKATPAETTATPPAAAAPDLCAIEFGVGTDAMTVVYTYYSAESVDCANILWKGEADAGGARMVALPSGPAVCEWHPNFEKIYGGAAAARSCALDAAAEGTP